MNNSFKATDSIIEKMIEFYNNIKAPTTNKNLIFFGKSENLSVLIYQNKTVMFQGKNAKEEINIWKTNEENIEIEQIDHIGSDEVGCGDYFGPIVVCACYVKKSDFNFLRSIGVKDSKQLNDLQIKQIAKQITSKIPHSYFVLSNKKYNEIHDEKNYNLNKIKAYLHNFVLYNLIKKEHFNGKIIVDDFCGENLYYNYLNTFDSNKIVRSIYFTTKAENKYLAVACSSIIARSIFINEMEKLEKKLHANVPYGAGEKVDELALKILNDKGLSYLKDFVKFHYNNTSKILLKKNVEK